VSQKPQYAELASQWLARAAPEPAAPSEADRERAIEAVRAAIRAKARRRLLFRGAVVSAAIAASISLYLALPRREPAPASLATSITGEALAGDVVAFRGLQELPLGPSVSIGTGDRVVTKRASKAELKLSTGTKVFLEDGGDLTVVDRGPSQVFALGAGVMTAQVAKLREGERFIVRTPDAELEARGTSFRLARIAADASCPDGLTTKLSVFEGIVSARLGGHEDRVGAGQEWTAKCPGRADVGAPTLAPAPSVTAARPAIDPPRTAARAASPPAEEPPAAPSASGSGLQTINDLYGEAMDAKRRGDKRQALSSLQRLTALYPSSHLAEGATVERMKILASIDKAAAAVVAREYLNKYPDGFARSLAESITDKNP
jgi:ferric-dicitrate binding protein FerR (iron transport regulator)